MPTAAEIGERMRRELERQVKALELDIDREERRASPVDTGHLQRNWIPSVSQPHEGEVTDEAAHAQGVAQVMGYKLEQGPLWVANAVPYLKFVDGKQPFIAEAVDRALGRAAERARGPIDVTQMRADYREQIGSEAVEQFSKPLVSHPLRPQMFSHPKRPKRPPVYSHPKQLKRKRRRKRRRR